MFNWSQARASSGFDAAERLPAEIEEHGFTKIVGLGAEVLLAKLAVQRDGRGFPLAGHRLVEQLAQHLRVGHAAMAGRALHAGDIRPAPGDGGNPGVEVVDERQHQPGRLLLALVVGGEIHLRTGLPAASSAAGNGRIGGGLGLGFLDGQRRRRVLHVTVRALDAEGARELLHHRSDFLWRGVFREDLQVARRRAPATARGRRVILGGRAAGDGKREKQSERRRLHCWVEVETAPDSLIS